MTNILGFSKQVTGMRLFLKALSLLKENVYHDSGKKADLDFQGLLSLELFPYKTPFKLFATHTHLQTVNKY